MEELLREFAEEPEPTYWSDNGYDYCQYCSYDDEQHQPGCLWRRAREFFGMPMPEKPAPPKTTGTFVISPTIPQLWEGQLRRALGSKE